MDYTGFTSNFTNSYDMFIVDGFYGWFKSCFHTAQLKRTTASVSAFFFFFFLAPLKCTKQWTIL